MGQTIIFTFNHAGKLGRNSSEEEFGYEIPESDHVGEFWAISAHPHGVSKVRQWSIRRNGIGPALSRDRNYWNRKEPVFPLLTKILDANY